MRTGLTFDSRTLRILTLYGLRSPKHCAVTRLLTRLMSQLVRYSPTVLDATIADSEGRGLARTGSANLDILLPARSQYADLQKGGLVKLLDVAFGPSRVYNVTLPLERNSELFATVRVGVSTAYLRSLSN